MTGIEGLRLGRYELRRRVAQGGMSEVYLGYDRRVRRRVAVKVLYGSNEPFVRRFEREALAVGTFSHDHILPLYDFGEQRPWYYLVMPYIEGGTLRDYLHKRERLSLEEAGSFLDQIASALQYAHDHGVVHRDVKPSNILLRPDGYAYLVDFGLAKAKMEAESLTHVGTMIGTPEYMAPEQSNGVNDYRSDIYALGIILYQMLTGQVPFTADTPVAISLKHIQTQPVPPRKLNNEIPLPIEEIILKALAKDPDKRYQQATAFSAIYWKVLQQEHRRKQLALSAATAPIPTPDQSVSSEQDNQGTDIEQIAEQETIHHAIVPRLFPLDADALPIPLTLGTYPKKKKKIYPILIATLAFILASTAVLFSLIGQANSTYQARNYQGTSTAISHQRATATSQAEAQAALAAQARVRATAGITSSVGAGNVLYTHDMTRTGGGWIDDGNQCFFTPEGYHVSTDLTHAIAWCYSNQRIFSDVVITAQAQLLRGDIYGLIFRLNPASKTFYVLEINRSGEYRFRRATGENPSSWLTLVDWTQSSAINSGYGAINTVLVVATEKNFNFYINKQLIIANISDTGLGTGLIGFMVGGDSAGGTEAVFSNVWVFQK